MSEFINELSSVILKAAPATPISIVIQAIQHHFGGQLCYVPKRSHKQRDAQIQQQFKSGISVNDLCREYGLSNQQIRRITHGTSAKQVDIFQ